MFFTHQIIGRMLFGKNTGCSASFSGKFHVNFCALPTAAWKCFFSMVRTTGFQDHSITQPWYTSQVSLESEILQHSNYIKNIPNLHVKQSSWKYHGCQRFPTYIALSLQVSSSLPISVAFWSLGRYSCPPNLSEALTSEVGEPLAPWPRDIMVGNECVYIYIYMMGIWWVYHGYIMGSTQFVLDSKDSPFFRPWFASGWEYCEMNMAGSISWTGSAQASWQVGPKMRANQILSPQVKLCHLAGNPTKIVYYLLCKKNTPVTLPLTLRFITGVITSGGGGPHHQLWMNTQATPRSLSSPSRWISAGTATSCRDRWTSPWLETSWG